MDVIWLAIVGIFLLAVIFCLYALAKNKNLQVLQQQNSEKINALKHELTVVNSAAMGVGQRLINVEKKLKISIDKQQQMELHSADQLPYNEAASMAEEGANVQQLMDRYGLPEAEASLLSLLKSGPGASEPTK